MFYIKPIKYKGVLSKYALVFSISQHIRDLDLFYKIKDFLACGVIETRKTRSNEVVYNVYKHSDIINKVIAFFINNRIIGVKYKDFLDFHKATTLDYTDKEKLNSTIGLIKNGMNSKRK
jgi:hypothetical protein